MRFLISIVVLVFATLERSSAYRSRKLTTIFGRNEKKLFGTKAMLKTKIKVADCLRGGATDDDDEADGIDSDEYDEYDEYDVR